jgi:uncharacterized membrane protein YedE/YeeE
MGLAGGILWLALWFFGLGHSMADKGLKHSSLSVLLLGIFVLAGSILNLLLGWPPALSTGVAIGWFLLLAIMVAGMTLDAWRKTRHST